VSRAGILSSLLFVLAVLAMACGTPTPTGLATGEHLYGPRGVAVDALGNLFIAELRNNRVRRVDYATGIITTVAGTGSRGVAGDGGLATDAQLNDPASVALDALGHLYIAETLNNRVRRVDAATGIITTVAGSGLINGGFSGDGGLATDAAVGRPLGVAVDAEGNLFIAGNNRVRRVDSVTGVITTMAGTGISGFSGDRGPATEAQLNTPYGVAVDLSGNLYIADTFNERIRRVNAITGVITTVAGSGSPYAGGFSGDGGLAKIAQLDFPRDLAFDSAGNLFIADSGNDRVRRVDSVTGVITTVAGTGLTEREKRVQRRVGIAPEKFGGDGDTAVKARLYEPWGVVVDASGNLFIADWGNNRVRRVDSTTAVITTVAGTD